MRRRLQQREQCLSFRNAQGGLRRHELCANVLSTLLLMLDERHSRLAVEQLRLCRQLGFL